MKGGARTSGGGRPWWRSLNRPWEERVYSTCARHFSMMGRGSSSWDLCWGVSWGSRVGRAGLFIPQLGRFMGSHHCEHTGIPQYLKDAKVSDKNPPPPPPVVWECVGKFQPQFRDWGLLLPTAGPLVTTAPQPCPPTWVPSEPSFYAPLTQMGPSGSLLGNFGTRTEKVRLSPVVRLRENNAKCFRVWRENN